MLDTIQELPQPFLDKMHNTNLPEVMKSIILLTSAAATAYARPQYQTSDPHEWIAGGPNDCNLSLLELCSAYMLTITVRGPCPMMNTLANHGFLPRDGRNLTRYNVVAGLKNGINFNETLGGIMWEQAIIANPEPNATFFTLDQLNVHNLLEHDASLSRSDAAFGNNHVFNQTIFEESRKWWTDETITAKQLAHSKIYRQLQSRATNSNYTFSASTEEFSLGEVAAPIIVFGDLNSSTVRRDLVEFFFGKQDAI